MYHDTMYTRIDAILEESHEQYRASRAILKRLNSGHYPHDYVDLLMQPSRKSRFDIYDAYLFGQLHTAIMHGWILGSRWEVGAIPAGNAEVAWNVQQLATLSDWAPICATFDPADGAVGDLGDGTVSWGQPLTFGQLFQAGKPREVQIDSSSVCLEVGSTQATTTSWHLIQWRSVARWPYESKYLWILQLLNDDFWALP
jgi:hypothetical protein